MTLREVAIKNIRHNKSIYSAFFFASALSIYMFFLLLSLVMNKDFIKAVLSETVTGIFSAVLFCCLEVTLCSPVNQTASATVSSLVGIRSASSVNSEMEEPMHFRLFSRCLEFIFSSSKPE